MDNYSCPECGYNPNGVMTYDVNKGISWINYDQFGTPRRVQFANHSITEYVYAADGRRLKTRHRTSVPRSDMLGINQTASLPSSETLSVDSTEYIGSYVCTNGQAKRYNFDGGYLMLYKNIAIPRYYIKDHLGSNRMIVSSIGYINQHNIYYALGGTTALSSGQEYQQYKYTDKEYDPMHGLNQYDFGARNYDPAIGRFTSVDPLAEKYYHLTPYSYCGGDPVNKVDPDGRDIWTISIDGHVLNHESYCDNDIIYIGFMENGNIKKNEDKWIKLPYGTISYTHRDSYDEYVVSGDSYGTQLFEFLAENTEVEFGQLKIGTPEFGQNYITTTFNERHEGGISEVFNRLSSQSTVDVNFREWIHSHPGNTNWPSGFDNDTHEFKGSGDMQVAKSVTEGLSKVNWNIPIFKIYPIKDRKYVIFNAKSTRYDFY